MKALVTLVIGVALGAMAALLLAPESGEELRRQLEDSVNRSTDSLQQAWSRDMQEMNERVASLQAALQQATSGEKQVTVEVDIPDVDVEVDTGDAA